MSWAAIAAEFLRAYPSYRLDEVLAMPAYQFYALIKQVRPRESETAATVATVLRLLNPGRA